MRRIIIISAMLIGLFATCGIQEAKAQSVSIDFNTFYSELSPYGQWVDDPDYGKVWVCNEPGFRPYSQGYWAYTDYGWTWVSDYRWGWAPFHYGRWKRTSRYGWIWVPGYEWAPAWVHWSSGGEYYGWAPLEPGRDYDMDMNRIPADQWVFVPRSHIADRSVNRYYVDNSRNPTIIQNTTIINNIQVNNNVRYHAGPQRAEVEQVTHKPIQQLAIITATTPGKPVVTNNQLHIYKPEVKGASTATQPINKPAQPQQAPVNKTQPIVEPKPVQKVQPAVVPEPVQKVQEKPVQKPQPVQRAQQPPVQNNNRSQQPVHQQPTPKVQQQPVQRTQQQPVQRPQQQPIQRNQPPVQNNKPQQPVRQPVQQPQPVKPPVQVNHPQPIEKVAPPPAPKPQEQQPNREGAPEKKPPMG